MNCQAQKGRRRANRTPLPGGGLALAARRERREAREARDGRDERYTREERYANSKWGSAPAAAALPPPPTHWRRAGERCRPEPDRALPLKLLLNVA